MEGLETVMGGATRRSRSKSWRLTLVFAGCLLSFVATGLTARGSQADPRSVGLGERGDSSPVNVTDEWTASRPSDGAIPGGGILETPATEDDSCGLSPDGAFVSDPPVLTNDAGQKTPIADRILSVLRERCGDQQGVTWELRNDTAIPANGILQTPPADTWGMSVEEFHQLTPESCAGTTGCDADFDLRACDATTPCERGTCTALESTVKEPGAPPREMCAGPSASFYEEIYATLRSAQAYVDITSLDPPDGRFEAAIRNSITYLANTGRAVRIRMLFATDFARRVDPEKVLASLARDLPAAHQLEFHVGVFTVDEESWNHAKTIAIDDQVLIQGGHNFRTPEYLETGPIRDVSMKLSGGHVIDAHAFANRVWEIVCRGPSIVPWVTAKSARLPDAAPACPDPYTGQPASAGSIRSLSVARIGWGSGLGTHPHPAKENASDLAIQALLENAQSTIRLSVQDIGGIAPPFEIWDDHVIGALGRAVQRGVQVSVVQSTPCSTPDHLNFETAQFGVGWKPEAIGNRVIDWLAESGGMKPDSAHDLVCNAMSLAELRMNESDDVYVEGQRMGSHAKFYAVDDELFYLGSQNLYPTIVLAPPLVKVGYPTPLTQFGVIFDDANATQQVLREYWEPLWEFSKRTAVSGPGRECKLKSEERDYKLCEIP